MRPEHATAILLFDYLAAVSFGTTAAVAARVLVPGDWVGAAVMIGGMAVGILAVAPVFLLFSLVLGGFEIVVLATQIGMLAGMVGAMSQGGSVTSTLWVGAFVGFAVHLVLRLRHRSLHGEVDVDE